MLSTVYLGGFLFVKREIGPPNIFVVWPFIILIYWSKAYYNYW